MNTPITSTINTIAWVLTGSIVTVAGLIMHNGHNNHAKIITAKLSGKPVSLSSNSHVIDDELELKARPAVLRPAPAKRTYVADIKDKTVKSKEAQFWDRVHFIESASGKLKYQGNDTHCRATKRFCGNLQIGYQALKDINCTTKKCFADRDSYHTALPMAKKILEKKISRYSVKSDWLKYAIFQQGANGLRNLVLASKGKKKLSRRAMKRIARNSIYTMRDLRIMGSRKAAISYLNLWRVKWQDSALQIARI